MAPEAVVAAWRESPFRDGRHAQLLVHLAVADVVNDVYDWRFWMDRDELAAKATVSVRSVVTTLSDLVDAGWLEVVTDGGGRGHRREYRWIRNRATVAPFVDGKGATSDVKPCNQTRANHLLSQEIPTAQQAALELDESALADEFETWWSGYRRKTDKAKARRCYTARRREGTPAGALLQARDNYMSQCDSQPRTATEYVKHGATFLAKGPDAPWREWLDGDPNDLVEDDEDVRTPQQQLAAGQAFRG